MCFPGGRPPTRPHAGQRRPSLRASALTTARRLPGPSALAVRRAVCAAVCPCRPAPAVCYGRPPAVRWADRTADGLLRPPAIRPGRPLRRPPAVRWADRTADGLLHPPAVRQAVTTRTAFSLIPAPGSPPPPPTVLSTVRFLGEYKEGSTNTLNLLPNLCFPRALSCTLHLLLGKPLLRKSEIVLGVSFGTPNTISAAWLLHSFYSVLLPSSQWAANHGPLGIVKSLQKLVEKVIPSNVLYADAFSQKGWNNNSVTSGTKNALASVLPILASAPN